MGDRTFICGSCQRELPLTKETKGWCEECRSRQELVSKQGGEEGEEGNAQTEFRGAGNMFGEDGTLTTPDELEGEETPFPSRNDDSGDSSIVTSENTGAQDDSARGNTDNTASVNEPSPTFVDRENTTVRVERGKVRHYELELTRVTNFEYQVTVTAGPNADLVVLDDTNFERWLNGDNAQFYQQATRLDTREAHVQVKLPAGTQYLLIDNSHLGKASPPVIGDEESATIECDVEYALYH